MLTTQLKDIKQHFKNKPNPALQVYQPPATTSRLGLEDRKQIEDLIVSQMSQVRSECDQRANEIAYIQARKVLAEREQAEVLIEGRANQFTVDTIETKL